MKIFNISNATIKRKRNDNSITIENNKLIVLSDYIVCYDPSFSIGMLSDRHKIVVMISDKTIISDDSIFPTWKPLFEGLTEYTIEPSKEYSKIKPDIYECVLSVEIPEDVQVEIPKTFKELYIGKDGGVIYFIIVKN